MSYIESALEKELDQYVSPTLETLINRTQSDLYYGPMYLTEDGEVTSMFDDDYHHAFDFCRACQIIKDTLDRRLPNKLYYETWSGCWLTDLPEPEPEYDEIDYSDYYEFCRDDMIKSIVGRELSHHVR